MTEINLNLEKIANEIVIRQGTAEPIELPGMDVIEGDINTISSFVNKRYTPGILKESIQELMNIQGLQYIDRERVIVTVDREKFEIMLELDPEHTRGAIVKGKLSLAPELEKFCINTAKSFTREELVKLIRFNRIWFQSNDSHYALLMAYMSFKAEVNANIGKSSDTRGNVDNTYKKTVTTNIPESFVLNIPVFKGQGKRQFRVDIVIEATDASTRFWLESVELNDLIQIESEQILNKQLECCKDFVIVYK